jgi:hypothetical protein
MPSPGTSQQQRQLAFVLNDGNISMLARNAVMLHMIIEQEAPADAVLAVWANHALTDAQHAVLLRSCWALAEQPWPAWLSADSNIDAAAAAAAAANSSQATGDPKSTASSTDSIGRKDSSGTAEAAVRAACAAWSSCTLTMQHLLQERNALAGTADIAVKLSLSAVTALAGSSNGSGSSSSSGLKISKVLQKEIAEYIHTGSLRISQQGGKKELLAQPNLTLFKAPELQYAVYFSSSIFRAVQLTGQTAAAGGVGAAELLLRTVGPQVAAVAAAAQQGTLRVALVPGDILTVATEGRAATQDGGCEREQAEGLFDYIDTSNVSDYT